MIKLQDILSEAILNEARAIGAVWKTAKGFGGKNKKGKVAYFYGDASEARARQWAKGTHSSKKEFEYVPHTPKKDGSEKPPVRRKKRPRTIRDYKVMLRKSQTDALLDAPHEARGAIAMYTGNGYDDINRMLRGLFEYDVDEMSMHERTRLDDAILDKSRTDEGYLDLNRRHNELAKQYIKKVNAIQSKYQDTEEQERVFREWWANSPLQAEMIASEEAREDYKREMTQKIIDTMREEKLSSARERVAHLDAVIETLPPVPEDMVVYRGVSVQVREILETLEGDRFTDDGFMSTSLDRKIASSLNFSGAGGAVLSITVPKGSRGIYPNAGDVAIEHEEEFILPRGTTIEIVRVEEDIDYDPQFNFRQIIHARVVLKESK